MQELIKIYPFKDGRVINARELHTFLESKQDFSAWIKARIKKYDFVENRDYYIFKPDPLSVGPSGGRPETKYGLTIAMAKEMAMVENNAKGKLAREYFIKMEEIAIKAVQKPIDMSDSGMILKLAEEYHRTQQELNAAKTKVAELEPKAEFLDLISNTDELLDFSQVAKVLELPYGRNTLFERLRELKVVFGAHKSKQPYQEYINRGYFALKECFIERTEGIDVYTKILVTQKGLEFIAKILGVKPKSKKLTPATV